MRHTCSLEGKSWSWDASQGHPIGIPLHFGGEQPNAFHLPRAEAIAVEAPGFVGDVRRGGSANCESLILNPHGNGTHTECVGHIVAERVAVHACLQDTFIPGTVISVDLVPGKASGDSYVCPWSSEDQIICAENLRKALQGVRPGFIKALVIRTPGKNRERAVYSGQDPAFLSLEAMRMIHKMGVEHLLIDLPSVDRESDQGELLNHRIFWGIPRGEIRLDAAQDRDRTLRSTITEMILVGDEISDGPCFLNIQIPAFMMDAAPSRPILFQAREE